LLAYWKIVKRPTYFKFLSLLLVSSVIIFAGSSLLAPQVKAAEAEFGLVRLNRMKVGILTGGGTVCLKPSAADNTVTTITVGFPDGNGTTTGYDVSQTEADFTADTDATLPAFGQYPGTTATAFPGIDGVVPGTITDQDVTWTVASTSLSSGTVYCFHFGNGLTARANAASNLTGTIATNGSTTQTAVFATATISEDTIGVTATVPQIFNFSITGTSIGLGSLSTSAVTSGSITAQIGTNAKNGWVSWIKNTTNGLYSSSQISAISVPTGSYPTIYDLDSTTGYVLDAVPGTGTPTIDTAYDGNGTSSGGILTDSFKQLAFKTSEGSADTVVVNLRAKVTTIQAPATDYADTLTIAAAGEF
jgi:hypothetical protein